jgi:hypothetical protein
MKGDFFICKAAASNVTFRLPEKQNFRTIPLYPFSEKIAIVLRKLRNFRLIIGSFGDFPKKPGVWKLLFL